MALTYGFYNSIEGDRVYDAIQFGRIFDGIIKDGVYATYEKGMMVIASSNPGEVIIQPGRAWFNHTWSYNDANVIFEAPAPEVLLERIDALVLEINEELSARENSYKWVTGTPSSRPERPTLTNTSTIHQYPLCYVHRYPETTMIYTRDITNMVGTSECPFATGVLEGIDLDAWINQWDDEFHTWENSKKTQFEAWMLSQETTFTTWYNAFKDQMASDVQEVEDFVDYLESVLDASTAIHLQEEIDELKDEISSGSYITVTTINPELYGRNVTITESGGTVFTEKFDNTGVAVFKSVPYVGNLTISSTYGTQTAERVVNTPYYARYEFAIAFWAATVNIIGDPEMAGYSVTVKDSNESIVGTVVLDNLGTGVYTAIKPDTYKFSITYGGETMEVTLSVTQETTYTVDLHAAGFKWQDWLEAGGVTGSYSSLDDVLADEVALRRLFTVHASVDYMAGINDENEDVEKIINTDLAAKWINLRDYALDTLAANAVIKGYMDVSHKELKPQVPTMTSNTTPYGVAFSSTVYSTREPWKAFNGLTANDSDTYASSDSVGCYVGYKFTTPTVVKKIKLIGGSSGNYYATKFKIQASNDNDTWDDLTSTLNYTTAGSVVYYDIDNNTPYLYYRMYVLEVSNTGSGITVRELQFYAYEYSSKYFLGEWTLMPQVPTMTSNTAPYGEASASSTYSGGSPYYAFDGNSSTAWAPTTGSTNNFIKYQFVNPTIVKEVRLQSQGVRQWDLTVLIQGSNTDSDSDWTTVCTKEVGRNDLSITFDCSSNETAYLYYRLFCAQVMVITNQGSLSAVSLQFYAWQPKGNVPVMTSNSAPYGEASASVVPYSSHPAWHAFDGNSSTAYSAGNTANAILSYKFTNPVCVKRVLFDTDKSANFSASIKTWDIIAKNDASANWETIYSGSNDDVKIIEQEISCNQYYLYWGIKIKTSYRSDSYALDTLQFYGRELSDLVPPMISNILPSGEASASSSVSGQLPYKAFMPVASNDDNSMWHSAENDVNCWLQYEFPHPVKAMFFICDKRHNSTWYKNWWNGASIKGSNDGITWSNDLTATINWDGTGNPQFYEMDATNAYKYFRIANGSYTSGQNAVSVTNTNFYGLDYSEKEYEEGTTKKWLYDHGVELETFTDVIEAGDTGAYINHEADHIKLYSPSSGSSRTDYTYALADATSYNLVRAKMDKEGYYSADAITVNGHIYIFNGSSDNVLASVGNIINNAPNNFSIDISSINQSIKVAMTIAHPYSTVIWATFKELWLE